MRDQSRQPSTTGDAADVAAEVLFKRVTEIVDSARGCVARAVNTAMVEAYWEIGREIVEVEQAGERRANYGHNVLRELSQRLTQRFGAGFTESALRRMRQMYLAFPPGAQLVNDNKGLAIGATAWHESTAPRFLPLLSWSHYRLLLSIADASAHSFYEVEAASGGWSVRELERQIASQLYERLAASRDKDDVLALARQGQEVITPQDVMKDPLVLEFLGLPDRPHWHDGDHFFVDLVLYNRLLRCFVLIDLKLGKVSHRDLGQLQMYVNWYDRTQREPHEEPTVGIALCSRKNDAVVRMTLPEGEKRIVAARYEVLLPGAKELEAVVQEGRRAAERRRPGGRGPAL